MTFYLGLDPGRTTGAVWCSYRDGQLILHDFEEVVWPDFMKWVSNWETKMDGYIAPGENVIVVCEDFILRKSAGWTPTPVDKQIGVLYGKAYDLGWGFALQQPMIKPAGYKLAKLKKTSHWGDAYAHAVYAIHNGVVRDQKIIW